MSQMSLGEWLLRSFINAGESVDRGVTQNDVEPRELKAGVKVEMEHTTSREISERIALDHLAEHRSGRDDFDRYYTALSIMEQVMKAGRLDEMIALAAAMGIRPKLGR